MSGATTHSFVGGAVVVEVVEDPGEDPDEPDVVGASEPVGGSVVTGAFPLVDVTISDAPLDEHAAATIATATTRARVESFDIEREDTGSSSVDPCICAAVAFPHADRSLAP